LKFVINNLNNATETITLRNTSLGNGRSFIVGVNKITSHIEWNCISLWS